MKIIGCDYHRSYQQIAMVDGETSKIYEGPLEQPPVHFAGGSV